ncbi:MAG: LPS export ABC transporter periplasmic protein LptC [Cocleimonas sp.]|nr:LPS export ABC transporter periplasmic protein LptC [Cocleimonas sp.]
MNRSGLLLLVLSVLIAIVITWLNSTWLIYKGFQFTQKVKKIDYYLSDFTLLNTLPNGQMRYFVTAEHLVHQQSTNSSEIFKPLLQASDVDGSMITLKSDKAEQNKEGIIKLVGDVNVIKNSPKIKENFELITHDLIYNPKQKALSSTSKVIFTSYQGQLQGVGFSSKLDEQELRIHSNVRAEFNPAK